MSRYAIFAMITSQLTRAAWDHDKPTTITLFCGLIALYVLCTVLDTRDEIRRVARNR